MTEVFFRKGDSEERGVERISHFFLTSSDPGKGFSPRPGPSEESAGNSDETRCVDAPAPVYAILSPEGLRPQGALLGCLLALSLSGAGIPVGLVETTMRLPHTFFLSGGYLNIDAVFWEADARLPEFQSMVARLRKTSGLVILNIDASKFLDCPGLKEGTRRCIVPTTVHPETMLHTYAVIKRIVAQWGGGRIELVVVTHRRAEKAAGAALVLEEMSRRFLSCVPRFVGSISMTEEQSADGDVVSESLLQDLPAKVKAAARDIAFNLVESDGVR